MEANDKDRVDVRRLMRRCGLTESADGVAVVAVSVVHSPRVEARVWLHGCQLNCRQCHDVRCIGSSDSLPRMSPATLYSLILDLGDFGPDNVCTVVFGGGEPCLHSGFIADFRKLCGDAMLIEVETTLNAPFADVRTLSQVVNHWLVDIKVDDAAKFAAYTKVASNRVRNMLFYLTSHLAVDKTRISIRVPVIDGYVSPDEAKLTADCYRAMGFDDVAIDCYRDNCNDSIAAEPDAEYRATANRQLTLTCPVAGLYYYVKADDDVWQTLEHGTEVKLKREPYNPHDFNAVAVQYVADDMARMLGYVPRSYSAQVARMLDGGQDITASVADVDFTAQYHDRLTINIFVDADSARTDHWYVTSLQKHDAGAMQSDFARYGAALLMRQPEATDGQPLRVGTLLVLYLRRSDDFVTWLVRVQAVGEECVRYIDRMDAVLATGSDIAPIAVANVKGPLVVPRFIGGPLFDTVEFDRDRFNALDELPEKSLRTLFDTVP